MREPPKIDEKDLQSYDKGLYIRVKIQAEKKFQLQVVRDKNGKERDIR